MAAHEIRDAWVDVVVGGSYSIAKHKIIAADKVRNSYIRTMLLNMVFDLCT